MAKSNSSRRQANPSSATTKTATETVGKSAVSRAQALTPAGARHLLRRATWLLPVTLALLFSAASLGNDFASDDTQQVVNNVFIKELKNLPLAFTSSVWSFVNIDIAATSTPYYRPLFSVWLGVTHALVGVSAFGWHLSNVLLHALATLLVFVVLRRFTNEARLALLTACLFAVHPTHAESVAWISGVTDPLLALFVLPAFYFYLRFRERAAWHWLALVALFFLLALWSKETALGLAPVIAYCEFFHFKESGSRRRGGRQRLLLAAALLAPTMLYFLMRREALGAFISNTDGLAPTSLVLNTIPLVLLKYLKLMTLPFGYSYQHYTPWVESIASLRFLAPMLGLVVIAALVALSRSPLLRFAAVWFLALLLPVLVGLGNFDLEYLVQERYLYLPSIGFCLAVALGVEWLRARLSMENPWRVQAAVLAVIILVWGTAYIRHSRAWHDTTTIMERCVEVEPDSPRANGALATIYFGLGRSREAEALAQRALQLDPHYLNGYQTLSYFSKQLGRTDEAIAYLEQAIAKVAVTPVTRNPLATVYLNAGLLYGQKKEAERAEAHIKQSLELRDRAVGNYHVGYYYFSQERYEEALPYYEKAVQQLPPNYAPIHLSIAVVYEKLGQTDRALTEYRRYLQLAPPTVPDRSKVQMALRQLQEKNK